MECKGCLHYRGNTGKLDLIATLWNVKFETDDALIIFGAEDLIDTLWNVKYHADN